MDLVIRIQFFSSFHVLKKDQKILVFLEHYMKRIFFHKISWLKISISTVFFNNCTCIPILRAALWSLELHCGSRISCVLVTEVLLSPRPRAVLLSLEGGGGEGHHLSSTHYLKTQLKKNAHSLL